MDNFFRELERRARMAESLREEYPVGTRILLNYMSGMDGDSHRIPDNTRGTVIEEADDACQIYTKFDNGHCMRVCYGEDSFRKLTDSEIADEMAQKADEAIQNGNVKVLYRA